MNEPMPAWEPAKEWRDNRIVEQLEQSALYQDYERAFSEATGLPLSLAPAGDGQFAGRGKNYGNPFCELLARHHQTCATCLRSQQETAGDGLAGPRTFMCFAGLCESSVAIRSGEKTIAFLRTGEVATLKPSRPRFERITRHLREGGADFDEEELSLAYFATPVMPPAKYRSILDLLAIFAGHLSLVAGQILLNNGSSEAPNIACARQFIHEHQGEPLELKQVAGQARMSSCYFCRKFKEATGFTFTKYVARTRVETAKKLLLNPQVRISEVAFEVGFQSITHFNRVFKEITGQCPSKYREELPGWLASVKDVWSLTRTGKQSALI
jgi:AraC-like DNA-binding protein/ligand-binding sensor protein